MCARWAKTAARVANSSRNGGLTKPRALANDSITADAMVTTTDLTPKTNAETPVPAPSVSRY